MGLVALVESKADSEQNWYADRQGAEVVYRTRYQHGGGRILIEVTIRD